MKNRIIAAIAVFLITFANLHLFAQDINFIAIGDWGREGKYLQKETADAMGVYAEQNSTKFVITLGDNIYNTGVTGTDDPKWQTCFELVYTAPSLQIPWYASLGNHDYYGNVQAQIDYTQMSTRWKMPARYYSFENVIDGQTTVLFLIIDTNPFLESYRNMKRDGFYDSFIDEVNSQNTEIQLKWIDSILSASSSKWKIVAGHHPVFTGGEHGNTEELIQKLEPLLEKHKVDMYLAGHDHDLQYLKKEGNSVNYFVSGAGSKLRETSAMEYTKFCKSINGFLGVTLSADNIKAIFTDYNGSNLYEAEIKK
jgi:tartrate-resistant acid phosphatase type 5